MMKQQRRVVQLPLYAARSLLVTICKYATPQNIPLYNATLSVIEFLFIRVEL